MIQVFFKSQTESKLVAIFQDMETFNECLLSLRVECERQGFEWIYENIEDGNIANLGPLPFPYKEGEWYYTIEPDGYIIESCWDDISEYLHTPDKLYFDTQEEAEAYLFKK
jgi:hypothetical protein